ncbi:HEAT repeat domain-containing protein [Akkermansiaceae bacterium]|jgi:hypothetical protein|nr:HEAT repeat domain-containing protein [Akkermansiaceae bacterium]
MKFALLFLPLALAVLAQANPTRPLAGPVRDLRKEIDFERVGEFHLGPTGAMGWMHVSPNFMTGEARQILVTKVEPGSSADGVLQAGDVLLGASGGYFSEDARKALGRAIDEAETEKKDGALKLIRWRPKEGATPREGKVETVSVKLKVLGAYAESAPYECPKSARIMDAAVARLLEEKSWGKFGEKVLALLATGEKKYHPLVREFIHEAKFAKPDLEISLENGGLVCWGYGYHSLILAEYYLATGDDYVLPALREYAVKVAMGQSSAGTWGHGFAWTSENEGKVHGRLRGYGAVNQAGLPCFLSLILARKCGIEHSEIEEAIARGAQFFGSFVGHGSIGYGFHRPSLEIYANGRNGMSGNGKNGIAAVAFRLLDDEPGTRFFSRLTASLSNTMEYGHSGNSYSYFWDVLGAHCGGPEMAAAFQKELRWYYALTRKGDGGFVYQQLGGIYGKGLLDPTVAQVLIASLPLRALYLTGKGMSDQPLLSSEEVAETIAAGRWRLENPDVVDAEKLISSLNSWSPIGREWIARLLAKKEGNFTKQLLELLKNDTLEARAGACAALGHQGRKAGAAVEALARSLGDDPAVAIAASYALARVNKPAAKVMPELLEAVLAREEDGEMRPVQQAMAFAIGYDAGRVAPLYFDGLLPVLAEEGDPLEGVDRELLHPALAKLLRVPGGRTRGTAAYAFVHFSREDLGGMAQEVHDAVAKPAPHYRMFSDQARQYALDLMLEHRIAEGVPLALESIDLKDWGLGDRLPHRWKILKGYGGSAKPYLDRIKILRTKFKPESEGRKVLEEIIALLEAEDYPTPLVSLHTFVDEKLASDLAVIETDEQRVMACRALIKNNPGRGFYQAACLRKLVALLGDRAKGDVERALKSEDEILRKVAEKLSQ